MLCDLTIKAIVITTLLSLADLQYILFTYYDIIDYCCLHVAMDGETLCLSLVLDRLEKVSFEDRDRGQTSEECPAYQWTQGTLQQQCS